MNNLLALLSDEPYQWVSLSLSSINKNQRAAKYNFILFYNVLLVMTLLWLAWMMQRWFYIVNDSNYLHLLYQPNIWLGKLLFPTFPSYVICVFYGVAFLSVICIFKYPDSMFLKALLFACLLIINIPENSLTYFFHQNHLFLLCHFFAIPMPYKKQVDPTDKIYRWYYFALLSTYTLAGIWKLLQIINCDLLHLSDSGISWANTDAIWMSYVYTAVREGARTTNSLFLYNHKHLVTLGILVTIYMECISVFAAFRQQLRLIVIPWLVVFHILSFYFLFILFWQNIIILICLFFPYHMLIETNCTITKKVFTGQGIQAEYNVIYNNGDSDKYRAFYAYRAYYYDKNALIGALFYLPGLSSLMNLLWTWAYSYK